MQPTNRLYKFDNIKFILMFLVIFGHVIESVIHERTILKYLYYFIYLFHMPLFIFISGLFSKKTKDSKLLMSILLYLLFQSLYFIFMRHFTPESTGPFSIFYPIWIMWFLFSDIIWKIITPFFSKIKYVIILAVILSLFVGTELGAGRFLSFSRLIVFYPFFLAGYLWKPSFTTFLQNKKVKIPLLLFTILGIFIYLKSVVHLPVDFLFATDPYHDLAFSNIKGISSRLFLLVVSSSIVLTFIAFTPEIKIPLLSKVGASTLGIFLLHGFILKYPPVIDFIKTSVFLNSYLLIFLVLTLIIYFGLYLLLEICLFNKCIAILTKKLGSIFLKKAD